MGKNFLKKIHSFVAVAGLKMLILPDFTKNFLSNTFHPVAQFVGFIKYLFLYKLDSLISRSFSFAHIHNAFQSHPLVSRNFLVTLSQPNHEKFLTFCLCQVLGFTIHNFTGLGLRIAISGIS